MKVKDLIVENKIDEAPMGALKTFGLTSLSKVSPTASGKLQTGTLANQLSADFKEYLGQTGQTAEPEIVLAFLKSKGIPTDNAEKIIAAGPEKGMLAKGMDAIKGMVKGKGGNQQQPQQGQGPAPATGQNPQPKGRVEPKLEPEQPAQVQQPAASAEQPAATSNAPAATTPSAAQSIDAQPQATAGRKQGGGKVAGQLSTNPSAVKRREKRAAAKAQGGTSGAIDQFVKAQTGSNPITMKSEPQQNPVPQKQKQPRQRKKPAGKVGDSEWERNVQPSYGESIEYEYDLLLEALSKGQLDKIFMTAAQDAAKAGVQGTGGGQQGGAQAGSSQQQGGGQQQGTGGAQAGGGAGGAAGSFVRGLMGQDDSQGDGKVKGTLNVNQLAGLLPGVDPKMLAQAVMVVRQGRNPSRNQMTALGNAMIAIIKADAQTTTKVMQLLKRVSEQ